MKLTTFAISNNDWSNQIFSVVIQQAKDSARKIQKGIDVGIERKRFNNACNRIEFLAMQKGKEIKIDEKRFQEMFDSISSKSNLIFPFVEHDNLKAFLKHLDDVSKKYLTDNKAAVVFVLNEYSNGNIKINSTVEATLGKNTIKSNVNELNKVESLSANEIRNRFHKHILTSIEKGTHIGWINIAESEDNTQTLLRHEGIISCLREHIFVAKQPTTIEHYKVKGKVVDKEANEKRSRSIWFQLLNFFISLPDKMKQVEIPKTRTIDQDIIPQYAQFAFNDGSISEPFPLYCMMDSKLHTTLPVLKAALISCRHFELDALIDTCILRNSEISRRQEATIADQEKLCFDVASKFFNEILEKSSGMHVELYHTGLEPAVLGTYRAFLATILKKGNRGKLVITPRIYKGHNEFLDLKKWY